MTCGITCHHVTSQLSYNASPTGAKGDANYWKFPTTFRPQSLWDVAVAIPALNSWKSSKTHVIESEYQWYCGTVSTCLNRAHVKMGEWPTSTPTLLQSETSNLCQPEAVTSIPHKYGGVFQEQAHWTNHWCMATLPRDFVLPGFRPNLGGMPWRGLVDAGVGNIRPWGLSNGHELPTRIQ